jgi:N-acetylneuraminic acid mutarotase
MALVLTIGLSAGGARADKGTGPQAGADTGTPKQPAKDTGSASSPLQWAPAQQAESNTGPAPKDATQSIIGDNFDALPDYLKVRALSGLIASGALQPVVLNPGAGKPGAGNRPTAPQPPAKTDGPFGALNPFSVVTWGVQRNMAGIAGSNEPSASVHPYNGMWALSGGNSNNFNVTTDAGNSWLRRVVPACSSGGDDVPVWLAGNVNNGNTALGISLCTSSSDWDIPLSISTNAGQTWAVTGTTAGTTGLVDDREYLWVDYNPNSRFYGRIYATTALFSLTGNSYNSVGVRFSTNQGTSWNPVVPLNASGELNTATNHIEFPSLAIEPDGTIVAAWHRGRCCGIIPPTGTNKVMWSRSTDGGVTFPVSSTIVTVPANQSVEFNSTSPGSFRWSDAPNIAADPVDGTLYAVWIQYRTANVDDSAATFLSRSTNDGTNWSAPVVVFNNPNASIFQYMPWVTVSEDHVVHVTYGGGTTSNSTLGQFYVQSTDRGVTWSTPFQLSGSFPTNTFFLGDYQAVNVGGFNYHNDQSGNAKILATWTDNTSGSTQQAGRMGSFNQPDPIPLSCDTYTFTDASGSIDPGTTLVPGSQCDDCAANVYIPFSFQLYGVTFNNANVISNGTLQFNSANAGFTNSCLPIAAMDYAMLPHWDDLRTDTQTGCSVYPSGCGIFTSTVGTAPNRIFNIEWRAVYFSNVGAAINFEVRLFEGRPSHFEYVYNIVALNGDSATVGVQQDTGSLYTQYSCNTPGSLTGNHRIIWDMAPSAAYNMTFPIGPIVAGSTDSGNHCDDCVTSVILPFPYRLYDVNFTQANIISNGSLQFDSSNASFGNACLPAGSMSYAILPHWDDLRTDCGTCGVFTSITGSAPDRVFNIEWRAVYFITPTLQLNFEVRLIENQDRFEVVYGTVPDDGNSATVGVIRDSTHFTQFECNQGLSRTKIVFTKGPAVTLLGSITASDPSQTDRLFRDGTASDCAVADPCPGPFGDPQPRLYDQKVFVNTSSSPQCITVSLSSGYCSDSGSDEVHSAAYLGSFNPNNLCTNYLGDTGLSTAGGDVQTYSFTVGAGATFVVIVNMVETGFTCGTGYALTVSSSACAPVPTATPTHTATRTPTNTATPTAICPGDWTSQAVYPITIQDNAVAASSSLLYSFGGYSSGITVNSYSYNPSTNLWSAIASLPTAQEKAAAAFDNNNHVFIHGGWDSSTNATNTLYRYNIATNTYTIMASSPISVSTHALVYLNNKLYALGGCTSGSCSAGITNVQIYDIASNTWSAGTALPQPLSWENAIALNNFIYIAGGTNGSTESAKTYRYDPTTNTWDDASIADLPAARWGAAADLLKGKWLVVGGTFDSANVTDTALIWDPVANTWSPVDRIPEPKVRASGATVAVLQFFVPGGSGPVGFFSPTNDNQRFQNICQPTYTPTRTITLTPTATPTCGGPALWQSAQPHPVNIARYAFAQNGNDLYLVGGVSDGSVVSTARKYDANTNIWSNLNPVPASGEASSCAYFNSKLYCTQGLSGVGFYIYDIPSNTWSTGPNIPGPTSRYGAAAGAFNGNVYVVGGSSGGSNATNRYNIASNTWFTGTAAPSLYYLGGYTSVGQFLYIIGSYGASPLAPDGPKAMPLSSILNKDLGRKVLAPDANSTVSMRLDMSTGTWTTGPAWTPARADLGLAYNPTANKLYAIGGDPTAGGFFDTSDLVDELSLASWPGGIWTSSPPNLPFPRQANQAGYFSTGRAGGEIWSTGGLTAGVASFLPDHIYRPSGINPCPTNTPTITPTPTRTRTSTPTNTFTPTRTPTVTVTRTPTFTPVPATPILVGHVNWQSRPAQPNSLQQLPITLTLKSATGETDYPVRNTDVSGFFTVPVSGLANGTYNWRVKGPDGTPKTLTTDPPGFEANCGTVVLTGALTTQQEMGLMKAGDCNNDNLVNVQDFNILKVTFGKAAGDPGYDNRADFNGDGLVNILDFNPQKQNFGTGGCAVILAPSKEADAKK